MDSVKPVWQLKGLTEKLVECFVKPASPKLHAVRVVLGSETFLHECYPDAASAMRRATQIRDRLLKSGSWAVAGKATELTQHVYR